MDCQTVVQITPSLDWQAAGPSYSVRRLAESLAERDMRVHLASVGEPMTRNTAMLTEFRFRHTAGYWPLLRRLYMSNELWRWLASPERGLPILHVHGLWLMPNVYPGLVARQRGLVLIHAPRGMMGPEALKFSAPKKRLFAQLLQNRALASVTCWHATSLTEVADIRAFGLTAPIALIPNGIDVPDDLPDVDPRAARPAGGNGQETTWRTALYLGRLHRIKRLDRLLSAWARVEGRHPEWRLQIAGPSDGGYAEELRKQARQLGLSRVTIRDGLFGDEKVQAFRDADVFVLPTSSENFAMVVAESLANGTPVICTKGAPWEGLVANGCGWWVDQDPEPVAAALSEAMALPRQVLKDMGRRGRDWMVRDFSWDRVALDMEALYRWCLAKGEPPSFVHLA